MGVVPLQRAWTALEVLGGVVVVAIALWPVSGHIGDRLAGTLDAPYHAWLGWRISELWRHGQFLTVVIPDAIAPVGLDLRLIDGLFPSWVMALFNLLTGGNLIASYNLAMATGLGLDLWAGRRLAQALSTRRWVWFLSGVAFATAPALAGSAQAHIAFVYAFTLPLLVREAILLARGDVGVRFGRLAAFFCVAFLCSAYHLVFGGLTYVLILGFWPHSKVWSKAVGGRLGLVALISLVTLSPFLVSRISYERDERAAGSPDVVRLVESEVFSADALGAFTPPESLQLDLPIPKADLGPQLYAPLRPAFVGYVLLAGLVLLCFARSAARRPLLMTAAILWVLSLGPALHVAGNVVGGTESDPAAWLPYRYLQSLPGLGALRAPSRVSYALAAVLAAALAVGLDSLLDRFGGSPDSSLAKQDSPAATSTTSPKSLRGGAGRFKELAVAGVATVLVACSITGPMPSSGLGLSGYMQDRLEAIGRSTPDMPGRDGVLIIPWGCRLDDPRVVALQSLHRQPNIGCNPPPTATRWFSGIEPWIDSKELAALRCDQGHIDRRPVPYDGSARLDFAGVERLRHDLGVRYIIIDKALLPTGALRHYPEPGRYTDCKSVIEAAWLLMYYDQVSDGDWVLVDLDKAPPPPDKPCC